MEDSQILQSLEEAIERGDAAFVRRTLEGRRDLVDEDRSADWLQDAIKSGHPELIRVLADQGCSVDAPDILGVRPLEIACRGDDLEAVKALLACGADPAPPKSYFPLTAIQSATVHRLAILQLLRDQGGDLARPYEHPARPMTPIEFAALFDAQDVIEFLVAQGCVRPAATAPAAKPSFTRKSTDVAEGKWGSIVLRSIGRGGDVTTVGACRFGPPASDAELRRLAQELDAKLPAELSELLREFNGMSVGKGKDVQPFLLSTDEIASTCHFYDDWESDLVLETFPKIAFVCQQNGFSELWGVVLKAFKPFRRGQIVAFDHDRIHDAEIAEELFRRPYECLEELLEAKKKRGE